MEPGKAGSCKVSLSLLSLYVFQLVEEVLKDGVVTVGILKMVIRRKAPENPDFSLDNEKPTCQNLYVILGIVRVFISRKAGFRRR